MATASAFILDADRFEIVPGPPYTAADLDYSDPGARCNREQAAQAMIPLRSRVVNFESYELVVLGFPIWFGAIPLAVKSFCKRYDWTGKRVGVFVTGWDEVDRFTEFLQPYMPGAEIVSVKLFNTPNTPNLQRRLESL